ncbi:hypothetical protein EDC04DRAFT_2632203, partial [Pisolithus marmoratus]
CCPVVCTASFRWVCWFFRYLASSLSVVLLTMLVGNGEIAGLLGYLSSSMNGLPVLSHFMEASYLLPVKEVKNCRRRTVSYSTTYGEP